MAFRVLLTCIVIMLFIHIERCTAEEITLPKPKTSGGISVEEAIAGRRSVRKFTNDALTLGEVSQILWASGGATVDGVTGPTRAYPSAGALYPLEIYLVAGSVKDLEPGVYKYDWRRHTLASIKKGDVRSGLAGASLGQGMIQEAPITIVVTVFPEKVKSRYGERGVTRYVSMDAGHLGQNVHLEAESMGLGTVMVGAFMDEDVKKVLGVEDETPIYIMPVGRPER